MTLKETADEHREYLEIKKNVVLEIISNKKNQNGDGYVNYNTICWLGNINAQGDIWVIMDELIENGLVIKGEDGYYKGIIIC